MFDLEAQSSPTIPVAAYTHIPRSSSTKFQHKSTMSNSDPVIEFFGSTSESRHDRQLSADVDALPAYVAKDTALPQYSAVAPEPATLAMYLFKYGFLFPPFWILGALILFSPLREPLPSSSSSPSSSSTPHLPAPSPPPASTRWMPEKTESERHTFILEMRRVEVKWAKRCFIALAIFTCLAAGASAITWWALRKPPGV